MIFLIKICQILFFLISLGENNQFYELFFTSLQDKPDWAIILNLLQKYSINIYSLNNVFDMGKMDLKEILESSYKTNISYSLMPLLQLIVTGDTIIYNPEWSTKFNQGKELFLRGNFIGV